MTNLSILDEQSIAFIGGGNMASALIDGLLSAKHAHKLNVELMVSDNNEEKRNALQDKGIVAVAPCDINPLLARANIVVLAVKPQSLAEACKDLVLAPDTLVVSVMAGVSIDTIAKLTGTTRIVRTMPNLPATIGLGATGLYATVSDDDKARAAAIMSASGIAIWVKQESDLHTVTAVAGSAPAYFFYLLEHMIAKARLLGLDADSAKALAVQTMHGAAIMAKNDDPSELRAKVTSKGGTTHAAITHLETHHAGDILGGAMVACYDRSVELGSQ